MSIWGETDCRCVSGMYIGGNGVEGGCTRRAGVRVPSTSKRQIVFLMGRSERGGYVAAIIAVMIVVMGVGFL